MSQISDCTKLMKVLPKSSCIQGYTNRWHVENLRKIIIFGTCPNPEDSKVLFFLLIKFKWSVDTASGRHWWAQIDTVMYSKMRRQTRGLWHLEQGIFAADLNFTVRHLIRSLRWVKFPIIWIKNVRFEEVWQMESISRVGYWTQYPELKKKLFKDNMW